MIWDFFKKKKEAPSLDDLVLSKLKPGFLVDYDMKTYKVTAHNTYKWNEGGVTDEWELQLGTESWFLERSEEDGEVEWSLCQKKPISQLEGDVAKHIIENEDPPEKVVYQGTHFYFEADDIGEFFRGEAREGLSFVVWDYTDESQKKQLSIEQWGETKFDVTIGFEVEEYQFTNILPA
ncbi:MAG: DUF4178 domain-containing protein [Nitrospinaceae bacterium]